MYVAYKCAKQAAVHAFSISRERYVGLQYFIQLYSPTIKISKTLDILSQPGIVADFPGLSPVIRGNTALYPQTNAAWSPEHDIIFIIKFQLNQFWSQFLRMSLAIELAERKTPPIIVQDRRAGDMEVPVSLFGFVSPLFNALPPWPIQHLIALNKYSISASCFGD